MLRAPHRADETREWRRSLRATGPRRDAAVARLHALVLHAARFEVARRESTLPRLGRDELDGIALEATNDAVARVIARLDDYRGQSRFTTWVWKFAIVEAATKMRARAEGIALEPR